MTSYCRSTHSRGVVGAQPADIWWPERAAAVSTPLVQVGRAKATMTLAAAAGRPATTNEAVPARAGWMAHKALLERASAHLEICGSSVTISADQVRWVSRGACRPWVARRW